MRWKGISGKTRVVKRNNRPLWHQSGAQPNAERSPGVPRRTSRNALTIPGIARDVAIARPSGASRGSSSHRRLSSDKRRHADTPTRRHADTPTRRHVSPRRTSRNALTIPGVARDVAIARPSGASRGSSSREDSLRLIFRSGHSRTPTYVSQSPHRSHLYFSSKHHVCRRESSKGTRKTA